ncbi:hypothetical protein HHI36_003383 [Cryptolaemus montrouzieri]|uniref:Uncharacterized protein n=1 Tax=Cryptolaemus montrouzieri TaxID=559131 RepID=A0ABD2PDR3_9CUCU
MLRLPNGICLFGTEQRERNKLHNTDVGHLAGWMMDLLQPTWRWPSVFGKWRREIISDVEDWLTHWFTIKRGVGADSRKASYLCALHKEYVSRGK